MKSILNYLKTKKRNVSELNIYNACGKTSFTVKELKEFLVKCEQKNLGTFATRPRKDYRGKFFVFFYEPQAVAMYMEGKKPNMQYYQTPTGIAIKQMVSKLGTLPGGIQ